MISCSACCRQRFGRGGGGRRKSHSPGACVRAAGDTVFVSDSEEEVEKLDAQDQ